MKTHWPITTMRAKPVEGWQERFFKMFYKTVAKNIFVVVPILRRAQASGK